MFLALTRLARRIALVIRAFAVTRLARRVASECRRSKVGRGKRACRSASALEHPGLPIARHGLTRCADLIRGVHFRPARWPVFGIGPGLGKYSRPCSRGGKNGRLPVQGDSLACSTTLEGSICIGRS